MQTKNENVEKVHREGDRGGASHITEVAHPSSLTILETSAISLNAIPDPQPPQRSGTVPGVIS